MTSGPLIHRLWNRPVTEKHYEGREYPIYSDALFEGTLPDLPRIEVLNTIRMGRHLEIPALILRIDETVSGTSEVIDLSKTDTERWHGGNRADEICALLSLALRVRMHAEKANRIFTNTDPRGLPLVFDNHPPTLPMIPDSRRLIVPVLAERKNLTQAWELMQKLPHLRTQDATVLVKAARLYQHGAWLAESEPHLSWLLFVSAIETIAEYVWRGEEDRDILEEVRRSLPRVASLLERISAEDLRIRIAEELGEYVGATRKFINCLSDFDPGPPTERPSEIAQVNWQGREFRRVLAKIYEHRSKALHAGVAFPMPLCVSPDSDPYTRRPVEKPLSPAVATDTAVWVEGDLMMMLWVFEYLVSGGIRNWWASLG